MKSITSILPLAVLLLPACASGGRQATFHVRNEVKVQPPEGTRQVRIWLAMPQEDPHQDVRSFRVTAPVPHRVETDSAGNRVLYLEVDPAPKELTVVEEFDLTRREQKVRVDSSRASPLPEPERERLAAYLAPNQHVVIDDEVRKLSAEIVGGETNPVLAARRLYDWTLANIEYWVKDPARKKASPVGSTSYCLSTRTGNCTDFHSLWTSLARAAGIPTRMVYGSFLKAELDGKDEDQSYHCWPEFYAHGIGWVPHDVAVADIFVAPFPTGPENEKLVRLTTADGYRGPDPARVEYYFGNLDERRVTWSTGRDLVLSPPAAAGPVNALPKAHVEADGKPLPEKSGWTRKLTYRQVR